ncbi:hypothetical protein HOL21_02945 [Candidatus Woesearchaeota archaeon]|nr:hypothetical protein [Candidatus Woesearchaeota archaeon]MBT5397144.1 hypothetical protein [Candidatus Woesearchaeota archaeon]MBT5924499.1 hypothetical protein [Candidatus Woesearchaeota archaeon]MBT6367310.1 hypothetical protein [Candidatus Woesearchaeota archaeon]MBT7762544.1 hypothetical protein [Candidatus Woesearchaeota archaeon]
MDELQTFTQIRALNYSQWDASKVDGVKKTNSLDELCEGVTFLVRMTTPRGLYGCVDVVTIQEFEQNGGHTTVHKGEYKEFNLHGPQQDCGINVSSRHKLPRCCGPEKHYTVQQSHVDAGIVYHFTE